MGSKIFLLDSHDDGSGRLTLTTRGGGAGIRRLSCDLTPGDLQQLVLFSEANDIRHSLGDPQPAEVALDGLTVRHDPARDEVTLIRQSGFNEQSAQVATALFRDELAGAVDLCLTLAAASKHGELLREMIDEAPLPAPTGLTPDETEAVQHRLREIALILLAQTASERGSDLGKLLRAKKSRDAARQEVEGFVTALAAGLLPRQGATA